MDYLPLAIHSATFFAFTVFAMMSAFGRIEFTSESWWGRAALTSLYVYVAIDNIKPFAEALHKILGGE